MLNLVTNGQFSNHGYAQAKNARFSSTKSNIVSIAKRWKETYDALPSYQQRLVDSSLESAKAEFRRRNPNIKRWADMKLAEAKSVFMSTVQIDGTMQRQLDIFWVLKLLNNFMSTMVVPIQVYRPNKDKNEFLAWDGQHTMVLMWLIATQLFEENPEELIIPVNLYQSDLKAEMRANFISLNSKEGKKQLEAIDIFEQQVFGVRVDCSQNPIWVETERKQQCIEAAGLFVTAKKFGDDDQAGAITRLQEINKLTANSVNCLCKYLAHVTKLARPVEEKEMVMMAHYFDRCRLSGIQITEQYIADLAATLDNLFDADFSPTGRFWTKASNAYHEWHEINSNGYSPGRFNKEPVHGFPFLIAQLRKSFGHKTPANDSKSEFYPAEENLF